MERQKSLGLAGGALLQKDSHTILAITATLAAGVAIMVLAAGPVRVAAFWALSELLFAAYQLKRYRALNSEPVEGAAADPVRVAVLQERLLQLKGVMSLESFFSGWFLGAPFASLKRGNIEEFVAYGFFCKRPKDLSPEMRQLVQEYVCKVEETWGVHFEEGRTPGLHFMAHLWEDLRYMWKPLAVHLGAEAMGMVTAGLLLALGFRMHRVQMEAATGLTYWVRAARATRARTVRGSCASMGSTSPCSASASASASPLSSPSASRAGSPRPSADAGGLPPTQAALAAAEGGLAPLIFIHGVGLGLTPYLHFIAELLRALPGRAVVLMEVRGVSVSLTRRAVSADDIVSAAAGILARHGWASAAWVGHSYGTFVLSRLVQTRRELVQSLVLIDPVCMLTIYPQLLRNFVYRRFHAADGVIDSLRFVFSRDLIISAVFGRKFVWHKMCLWCEDLPPASLAVLSAGDDLVPTELIISHLKKHGSTCEVMCHPTAAHGGFLLDGKFRQHMLHAIVRTLEAGTKAT